MVEYFPDEVRLCRNEPFLSGFWGRTEDLDTLVAGALMKDKLKAWPLVVPKCQDPHWALQALLHLHARCLLPSLQGQHVVSDFMSSLSLPQNVPTGQRVTSEAAGRA